MESRRKSFSGRPLVRFVTNECHRTDPVQGPIYINCPPVDHEEGCKYTEPPPKTPPCTVTSSFTFGQARTYSIDGPRFAGLPPAFNGFPIQSLWVWLDLNSDGWTDYLGLGGYFPNEGSAWTPRPGFLAFGTASGYRLATAAEFPNPLLNVHAREVAVADFNGDGAWDIYIADHGYDAMPFPGYQNGLVLSTSPGRWIDATSTLPQVRDFTHSVSAGDLNGDGFQDLVVGNMGAPPNDVYVLLGDGRGGFRADTTLLPVGPGKVLDRTVRQVLASTV